MFVYGVCAGRSDKFERIAAPAIRRADPHASVIVKRDQSSIHAAYNAILDDAAELPAVEGVILLHDDTEVLDRRLEEKLRTVLDDQGVGVIGVIGGRGHREMPWWEGDSKAGYVTDNQQGQLDFGRGTHEVDTVDGLLLVLSPAALRTVRFDERRFPRSFHGYDADICAQARAAGLKVVTADLEVHHHNNTEAWRGDEQMFAVNNLTWQLKWRTMSGPDRLRTHFMRMLLMAWRLRRTRIAVKLREAGRASLDRVHRTLR